MDEETKVFLKEMFSEQMTLIDTKLESQSRSFDTKLESQLKSLDTKFESRMESFDTKLERQSKSFEAKLERQSKSFDTKLENQLKDITAVIWEASAMTDKRLAILEDGYQVLRTILVEREDVLKEKVDILGDQMATDFQRIERIEDRMQLPHTLSVFEQPKKSYQASVHTTTKD